MGNSESAQSRQSHQRYSVNTKSPVILVTYKPETQDSFSYSDKHFAYTNDLTKLEAVPPPAPPTDEPEIDRTRLPNSSTNLNRLDVSDAAKILTDNLPTETEKVRALWRWLTSQNIHRTIYKLTEDFNEVEYQLHRLKNGSTKAGNTFAALFALLCAYVNIPCVVVRGYVKGSLYRIGKPIKSDHLAEWNAVFVDGSWRLLDPFWGACSKNPEGRISCDIEDWFLFTEPRKFLYSHLPAVPEWQLVDTPIKLHQFISKPYLKERFFLLGMQDSVTPTSSTIETRDAEVNLLLPLDPDRAQLQEFKCITKVLKGENDWKIIKASNKHNQLEFLYYMKDETMTTLSIHIRFQEQGIYKLEVVGREETETESELNAFDWVVIYRVEVKDLPEQVIMFPKEPSIGWGPGDALKNVGLEAVSHQEGMIKFFPEDELWFEFRIREGFTRQKIQLRNVLAQKNGELLPRGGTVDQDDWHSIDTDGSVKFLVRLKVSAEYMLQIHAEVKGRDVGSVCNYLIVCQGEIIDKVLEEIKKLKADLKEAISRCNLFDLRRLTNLVKSNALHRHELMKNLYREALDVTASLQKREDIMRKLRNLNIPKVITEIKTYKQVPDGRVEKVMKASLILLGVPEKELKTWDRIRQQVTSKEGTESLPGKIKKLQENTLDFINDQRNKSAVSKAGMLLKGVETEDMERVSLAVVPLLEVIKLVVSEYRTANPTMFGRASTVVDDEMIRPINTATDDDGEEANTADSHFNDIQTTGITTNHEISNISVNEDPQVERLVSFSNPSPLSPESTIHEHLKMLPVSPRVES